MNDSVFNKIDGLKWLPWIGDTFSNLPSDQKIMIIGESHYHDNTPQSIEKHNHPEYTRAVIRELAIDRLYYGTKIFPNLYRALFGNQAFDSTKLWAMLSYHNFIQRTLSTNVDRPLKTDYIGGWKTFFHLVGLTKPTTCIFLGTTAANTLELGIKGTGFSTKGVRWEERIGTSYAKTATVQNGNGESIELIFIKHPSKYFPWQKWKDYLHKKSPKQVNWLKENTEVFIKN
ncbi:hypothetical protein [Algoriphagus marinus]|uniref:hypothetical protein n=1 Tax=Algoriphagus marinus TaxID=1925762 RepID=UPI00094B954D|nr:hypothetical protein [Algoriphagus marinus]